MSYTAIVPARSGSKRLPGKNIRELGGKPLLAWTLEACARTERVERVILSTDSQEYWELAQRYVAQDKLALDLRTGEEAGDKVKIFDYLKDHVDKIFAGCEGSFVLCLPTMPLRTEAHINEAIDICEAGGRGVFSAVEFEAPTSFAFSIGDDGHWQPVLDTSPMVTGNTRSQDQLQTYHPNGAIYIRPIDDLRRPDLVTLYQDALPYIMDRSTSVDIDTMEDFRIAEVTLAARADGASGNST